MTQSLRRSWLLLPVSQQAGIAAAMHSGADVLVPDLVEFVPEARKQAAREGMPAAVRQAAQAGKPVFAQLDSTLLQAELPVSVWPGLTGVVLSRVESVDQVRQADEALGRLEAARGMPVGSVEIVLACETAQGNAIAYELATASRRVSGLTLGRADLIMDLRPEPSGEFHMMQYLMQRLVMIAAAAGVMPIGAWWRSPDRGLMATPENTLLAARRGRALGFRGSLCVSEAQVQALNSGFTPSKEELTSAGKLVAGGPSTGRLAGWQRQADLLVDESAVQRARNIIDLGARPSE